MKRMVLFFCITLFLSAFTQPNKNYSGDYLLKTHPVNQGEELEFKLSYGWFTVGKADLKVSDNEAYFDGKSCYKVNISGKTAGLVGLFSKVDDKWGGYVEKDNLIPLQSFSDLKEGKYMRKENITFDHDNKQITVDMIKRNEKKPRKIYDIEGEVHDMISGYLNMRSINYRSLNPGDTVRFRAFYDEEFYDFGFLFEGKEMVDTEVGELHAYRIVPIMPVSKIFPDENPVTAWISADANQLPILVKAKMFFGTAYVELTNYKNIKYGPDFQ